MHIAKTIVIDTYLFFKNSMIYKIHDCIYKNAKPCAVNACWFKHDCVLKSIKQNTKSIYERDNK